MKRTTIIVGVAATALAGFATSGCSAPESAPAAPTELVSSSTVDEWMSPAPTARDEAANPDGPHGTDAERGPGSDHGGAQSASGQDRRPSRPSRPLAPSGDRDPYAPPLAVLPGGGDEDPGTSTPPTTTDPSPNPAEGIGDGSGDPDVTTEPSKPRPEDPKPLIPSDGSQDSGGTGAGTRPQHPADPMSDDQSTDAEPADAGAHAPTTQPSGFGDRIREAIDKFYSEAGAPA